MKNLLIACLATAFFGNNLFSQDDMDEIFDDGMKESKIGIGTDFITNFSGTINLHATVRPIELIALRVGIGFLPLKKHTDLFNHLGEGNRPVIDTALSKGFFYTAAVHFIRPTGIAGFEYSYYFNFKHWSYTAQEQFDLKKFKACFGMGYQYQLIAGISIEARVGVYLGREVVAANEQFVYSSDFSFHDYYLEDVGDRGSSFFNGFDVGIGVNYNF